MKIAGVFTKFITVSPGYRRDVLVTTITNLTLAFIGVVTGSLAARLLGPQGRGELAAIQGWPMFIAIFASLGLSDALIYFISRMPERIGHYLATAITIALVCSLFAMAFGYIMMPILLSAQTAAVVETARLYLLIIPLTVLVGFPIESLRGLGKMGVWNLLRLVPPLLWLSVLLAAIFASVHSPIVLAIAYLSTTLLCFGLVTLVIRNYTRKEFYVVREHVRPLVKYGVPSVLGSIPQALNLRLDQLLMAAVLVPTQLGLYAAAVAWSGVLGPLLTGMGFVLFPRVARTPQAAEQARVLAQMLRIGILVSLIAGTIAWLVTPLAMQILFGAEYLSALPAARVLVIAGAVAGMIRLYEDGLRGLGRPWDVTWAEAIGLVVTGVALWAWLVPYGIIGASYASLLSYLVIFICLVIFTVRATGLSPRACLIPSYADVQLIMRRVRAK